MAVAEYRRKKGIRVSLRKESEKKRTADKLAAEERKKQQRQLDAQKRAEQSADAAKRKAVEAAAKQRRIDDIEIREKSINDRLIDDTNKIPKREEKIRNTKRNDPPVKRYTTRRPANTYYNDRFSVINGGKAHRKRYRRIIISLIALLAVILSVLSAIAPVGVSEYFTNSASKMGGGSGFPLEVSDNNTKLISSNDKITTVIGEATYEAFNKNGKQLFFRHHGYLNPSLSVSEGRFMLFDRGSTAYTIDNAEKVLYTGNAEGKIFTAAIGRNGTTAFAVASPDCKAKLMVMNSKNENIYNWYSADADISALLPSDNGRRVAAATLSAQNGKFLSKIYIFDVKKNTVLSELTLQDSAAVAIEYVNGSSFLVLCDNQALLVSWKGETLYNYKPIGIMQLAKISGKHLIFAENTAGNSGSSIITVSDLKGKQTQSFTVNATPKDIAVSDNAVYTLTDNKITAYTYLGNEIESYAVDFSVSEIFDYDNDGILSAGFGQIELIDLPSSSNVKAADPVSN